MIKIIKDIFKLSEQKTYKIGDVADFGAKDNKRLISEGVAELIVKDTKQRKRTIKTK
jgi:hypothetical protein